MDIREWALVVFTILAQMSVGAFLVLGVVHSLAGRVSGPAEADRLADVALLAIGPTLALGMVASLFHLGSPLSAYNAVANLASSWLSREITFGVAFALLGAGFAVLQWRKIGPATARPALAWAAAAAGLALVYSMGQVYMLDSQPAWNSPATPVSFFATTLLLGSLAVGCALVAAHAARRPENAASGPAQRAFLGHALRWIAVLALLALGVEFVALPAHLAGLAAGPAAATASAALLTGQFAAPFALRLILVFLGAGILALFLYQAASPARRDRTLLALTLAAFTLALAGETIGRFLFYATHIRTGL